jgi:hypothetical protein
MSERSTISVSFPDLSPTEASHAAAELEEEINRGLRERGLAQIARQQRTDPRAQNLGDMVQLVFTAHGAVPLPAVRSLIQVIALGIQKYLVRTNRAHLRITQPDGTIIDLADIDSRDMAKIVAALEKNGVR